MCVCVCVRVDHWHKLLFSNNVRSANHVPPPAKLWFTAKKEVWISYCNIRSNVVSSPDNNPNHPLLYAGVRFQEPPQKKSKYPLKSDCLIQEQWLSILNAFIFFAETLWWEAVSSPPPQIPEHHPLRLEDKFELLKKFWCCYIHLSARVMYFRSLGDPANLRNCEVRKTAKKKKKARRLLYV